MVIVAATKNKHKIEEIEAITKEFGMEIVPRNEAGVPDFEVEEDGDTFEYNSEKKAREIMQACGKVTIADDSGLMVDALSGAPGVYSARFAGEEADDQKNNEKLLALMKDVPDERRTARFVSVIALAYPDGKMITVRGECPGRILRSAAGENGFGYDPLFVPDGYAESFAQLSAEEKNKISHRAAALAQLRSELLKDQKSSKTNA